MRNHWENAFLCCVFGLVFLTSLHKFTSRHGKESKQNQPVRLAEASIASPIPTPPAEAAPPSLSSTTVRVDDDSPAAICARFDPVNHPEQAPDIMAYASKVSGTPVDILYAVWQNETGVVYGSGQSDGCNVFEQLKIRCTVGGNCTHLKGLQNLADQFRWNLEDMRCSCGTATMAVNTKWFGGCCGPFQFSPGEIDKLAIRLNVDPMTFCGGAVIAGMELKKHRENFGSWEMAMQRYVGLGGRQHIYYANAYRNWALIKPMLDDRDHPGRVRSLITNKAMQSRAWSRRNLEKNTRRAELASN